MKLNYTDGCTATSLTVDGVATVDMKIEDLQDVIFCDGWENARGCRIEHEAAVSYGMGVMYENLKFEL